MLAGESFAQPAAGDGSPDDGEERAKLEDAVAPRESFLRQQFRQQTVFGWPENRAVYAHQKHARDGEIKLVQRQPGQREQHDNNLKHLHADGDGTLAEAVGEKSAGHRKHNERQREQRAHHGDEPVALLVGKAHARDEEDDEPLEGVVTERALELRDEERPEAATGGGYGVVGVHRPQGATPAGGCERKNGDGSKCAELIAQGSNQKNQAGGGLIRR